MAGACTIKEIARELGIAHSTVSRVLNNAPSAHIVSTGTRQRIMDAVARMEYVPNINARRLVRDKSNVIGVVLPSQDLSKGGTALSDPALAKVMSGMEVVFKANGYRMLLIFSDEQFVEAREYISCFKGKSVDGLIVWGARLDENHWDEAAAQNVVMINSMNLPESNIDYIGHDNFTATRILTQKLIAAGRRKIAYCDSFKGISISEERFAGYRQALADAGMPFDEKRCFRGVGTESVLQPVLAAMESDPGAFDAMQCLNDAVALTCGVHLQQMGLDIPNDVMLAGGDRIEDAYSPMRYWRFPILSFRPNCHEMGRVAAQWIIDGISNVKTARRKLLLPVEFADA